MIKFERPMNSMQVVIRSASEADGPSISLDTSNNATAAMVIWNYCSQAGIAHGRQLRLFKGSNELPLHKPLSALHIVNGENLTIGNAKPSILLDYRFLAAVVLLGSGLILIIVLSTIYGITGKKYPDEYAVVMDAGSSKTNTLLYSWPSRKLEGTGCVKQLNNCYAKGGIAKMDPTKLDKVINCAKNITFDINSESLSTTPLYFAATAGMRLLNITDPEKLKKILHNVDVQLRESGLDLKKVEIISGQEEGMYGWIAANFLQNTLEKPQKYDPWVPTTYGALDMGGASMQISFAVPDDIQGGVTNLQLYGQTHHVFAHSDLCFGRDEAERRYRYFLISKNFSNFNVEDPCAPSGYKLVPPVNGSDIFTQPCIVNDDLEAETLKHPELMNAVYNFHGGSDPEKCRSNAAQLLNVTLCQKMNFRECFYKLQNIPKAQKYLAFASYFFTTNFLNITQMQMKEFEKAVTEYCSKNYEEIKEISKSSYATQYCFNAQYILKVLTLGYQFTEDSWNYLEFVGEIADKDVGWTLGYMINATNLIPAKDDSPKLISTVLFSVLLSLLIIAIIVLLIYIGYYYKKNMK